MSIVVATIEEKSIGEKLRELRELEASPGWRDHILPMLNEALRDHTEAALAPMLTPEARAEHIQAVHAIRKIASFPTDRITELQATWKKAQKKPASA